MSEARDAILNRLRAARRQRNPDDEAATTAVDHRLGEPVAGLVPARARLDLEDRLEVFKLQAEAVETAVERVPSIDRLPDLVAGFLRRHNLPLRLVIADHPLLSGLDFAGAMIEVEHGRAARDEDDVGLTVGQSGIAETGTALVRSGPDTPTTLAFLPETAIIVLPTERVVPSYEEALRAVGLDGDGRLPRSVNFVTGPSRSADIEQTLQLGAHGPRRLLVVLVDGAERHRH